jgi:AraC-like DNA-binding protein
MEFINGADLWNGIILLGALQGFILSILVGRSPNPNPLANQLLGVLIFLLAMACTNLYLTESGLEQEYGIVNVLQQLLPLLMIMPVGPLIYFYVRAVTDNQFRLSLKHKWHFASAGIDLLPKLLVWMVLTGLVTGWISPAATGKWSDFIDDYNTYTDSVRWLSLTVYLLLARQYLLDTTADFSSPQHKWLHQFVNAFLVFQVIWLLFLIPYLLPATRGALLDSMSYYPIYIPLAILVYWLGFKGYLQLKLAASEAKTSSAENSDPSRHSNGSFVLPAEEVIQYIGLLTKAMEEDKLYLEPALQLQTVAAHTGIPQKSISYVLNNHLQKSFNEFVNEYRLAEVKRRLLEGVDTHLTIAGIALECGFNSQATFQRAFKNSIGVSPREFVSLHAQQSA